MTVAKTWTVDQDTLQSALQRFQDTNPDADTSERVGLWLEGLPDDPLRKGTEDPDHPGILFGRVEETNVGVLYVPDSDSMKLFISDISDVG